MNTLHKQRGMSMWCLILLIGAIVVISMVAIKLMPFYKEHMGVLRTINQVKEMPDAKEMMPATVQAEILKRLYINDVNDITNQNIKDHMTVEKTGEGVVVHIDYSRDAPFYKNIFLKMHIQEDFKF